MSKYVGSAQYHKDRIADLEAGNTGDLEQSEITELLEAHRKALPTEPHRSLPLMGICLTVAFVALLLGYPLIAVVAFFGAALTP
jgi:hypothetical protein